MTHGGIATAEAITSEGSDSFLAELRGGTSYYFQWTVCDGARKSFYVKQLSARLD